MMKRGGGLHETVLKKIVGMPQCRILDVGAGNGEMAMELLSLGNRVSVCDLKAAPSWCEGQDIEYHQGDLNIGIPFEDNLFDTVLCLEVIEHVENPFALCRELFRVLHPGGQVIISTPNILKIRSRVQFLIDGSFPWFDLPLVEWDQSGAGPYIHVNPIRFQELEYYIYKAGLSIENIFSSERSYGWRLVFPLELLIKFWAGRRQRRFQKRNRTPLTRIYSNLLQDDLLYGSHLIVSARKKA